MNPIRSVNHTKMEVNMKADKYFNDSACVQELEDMGMEVHPVDPFGGNVLPSKNADVDLKETEESIQERFQLKK